VFASEAGRTFGANGVDWAKGLGVLLWPSVPLTIATIVASHEWRDERAPEDMHVGLHASALAKRSFE
jgi:hypothetical protein